MSWEEPRKDDRGRLSLQETIFKVSSSVIARARLPKVLYSLGIPVIAEVDEAYRAFESFMLKQIKNREDDVKKLRAMAGTSDADIAESSRNIFDRLVNAALLEGKLGLSDNELIGNCFIFVSDSYSQH